MKEMDLDACWEVPLDIVEGLMQPAKPTVDFKVAPPTIPELGMVVQKASCKSVPGPNSIYYTVYKHCP